MVQVWEDREQVEKFLVIAKREVLWRVARMRRRDGEGEGLGSA